MKIPKLKHSIGDTVWAIVNNRVVECTLTGIKFSIFSENFKYTLHNGETKRYFGEIEGEVYKSKKELINSL